MRSRLAIFALVAVFPLAACGGDDGVGLDGDPLTEEEAAALAEYVIGSGLEEGFSAFEEGTQPGAPARIPIQIEDNVSVTVECPIAGTYGVTSEFTASGDTETQITANFTVTQVHDGCTVVPENTETQFTLDGIPNVQQSFTVVVSAEAQTIDAEGGIGGGLSWETDDERSGSCPVDLDYEVSLDGETGAGSATVAGTICGVDLSRSITIGGDGPIV